MNTYVVTGGGRGIGRAITERLATEGTVVVIEADPASDLVTADGTAADPGVTEGRAGRIIVVVGDAGDPAVAERAVEIAASVGALRGWVNNAAIFRDGRLHESPVEVAESIRRNLEPVLVGSGVAVRHFLAAGEGGAIVNISSHQGSRAVRGALPYATAKAAVEGLTRALAVDYGRAGVRTNALALGSMTTERSENYLAGLSDEGRERFHREIGLLQPLGRMGLPSEVAEVTAFLLSPAAAFINGAVIPVDGGRSAQGRDPEEAE